MQDAKWCVDKMATALRCCARISSIGHRPNSDLAHCLPVFGSHAQITVTHYLSAVLFSRSRFGVGFRPRENPIARRNLTAAAAMFAENSVVRDICSTALSGGVAFSVLQIWQETAKRGLVDQIDKSGQLHSGRRGAVLAALIPGVNIIKVLLLGLGIWKDEATVKSMSRYGDYRELLKGPLYYASAITLACIVYWRTSPVAIAAICNLCAGDGLADIVGRLFGRVKIPYNGNKSIAGSVAMATAGFIASVGYMYYFSMFGYIQVSWETVLGFLVVSLVAALVESHPISTQIDDNLTVPLASILVGSFVL